MRLRTAGFSSAKVHSARTSLNSKAAQWQTSSNLPGCDTTKRILSTTTQRPTGCRLLSLSYVQCSSSRSRNIRTPTISPNTSSVSWNHGTNIHLSDCHRRQGPLAWSPCKHRRQAASQWTEDCCRPLRGPQHLWRVLPRQAYVKPRNKVKEQGWLGTEDPRAGLWQTLLRKKGC